MSKRYEVHGGAKRGGGGASGRGRRKGEGGPEADADAAHQPGEGFAAVAYTVCGAGCSVML